MLGSAGEGGNGFHPEVRKGRRMHRMCKEKSSRRKDCHVQRRHVRKVRMCSKRMVGLVWDDWWDEGEVRRGRAQATVFLQALGTAIMPVDMQWGADAESGTGEWRDLIYSGKITQRLCGGCG